MPKGGPEEFLVRCSKLLESQQVPLGLVSRPTALGKLHQFQDLADAVLYRLVSKNLLSTCDDLALRPRSELCRDLLASLQYGGPIAALRLDIENCYETIPHPELLSALERDPRLSKRTVNFVDRLFSSVATLGATGLPRGLGISAATLEYLQNHTTDATARTQRQLRFYGRFVDDIILVAKTTQDLLDAENKLAASLPRGQKFGARKRTLVDCTRDGHSPLGFDYLGYRFIVPTRTSIDWLHQKTGKAEFRPVSVDVAAEKSKKIERRLVATLVEYLRSPDQGALERRLQILTQNVWYRDVRTGKIKRTGVYYNYPLVSVYENGELERLDKVYRAYLLHPKSRLSKAVRARLGSKRVRSLMSLSFVRGHQSRISTKIDPAHFDALQRCWKYV